MYTTVYQSICSLCITYQRTSSYSGEHKSTTMITIFIKLYTYYSTFHTCGIHIVIYVYKKINLVGIVVDLNHIVYRIAKIRTHTFMSLL